MARAQLREPCVNWLSHMTLARMAVLADDWVQRSENIATGLTPFFPCACLGTPRHTGTHRQATGTQQALNRYFREYQPITTTLPSWLQVGRERVIWVDQTRHILKRTLAVLDADEPFQRYPFLLITSQHDIVISRQWHVLSVELLDVTEMCEGRPGPSGVLSPLYGRRRRAWLPSTIASFLAIRNRACHAFLLGFWPLFCGKKLQVNLAHRGLSLSLNPQLFSQRSWAEYPTLSWIYPTGRSCPLPV
jgi:hypothetical protein